MIVLCVRTERINLELISDLQDQILAALIVADEDVVLAFIWDTRTSLPI